MRAFKDFKTFILFFVPILVWMGIIFYFSSIPGLKAGLSTEKEIVFRKLAHIFEFGILAGLFFRWFFKGERFSLMKSLTNSLIWSLGYASLDEIHQFFIYGRQGRPEDVAVDFLGISFFLNLIFIFLNRRNWKKVLKGGLVAIVLTGGVVALVFWMIREANEVRRLKLEQKIYPETLSEKNEASAFLEADWDKEKGKEDEKKEDGQEERFPKEAEKEAKNDLQINNQEEIKISQTAEEAQGKIIFDVPFTSQAPFGIWDEVHEEACEEASLIMVKFYLEGKELNSMVAEEEIQKLVAFQLKKYGDYKDSNMGRLVQIGSEYYGLKNLKVVYDFSKEDLKKNLQEGKIMIVPTAGRKLGNPFFTPPGPLYHNLVLKGFDGNKIITNDPGTRRGDGFSYDINVLYDAIFDFPGKKEDIEKGRKAILVVETDSRMTQ